jgi:hypothetical protein
VISNSFIASQQFDTVLLEMMRCMDETFDPKEKVWKTTGSKFLTGHLLEKGLVLPFESDRKYDYKSTKGVTILPYYYINMNHDHPRFFTNGEVNQASLKTIWNNKDEKYIKHNNFDDECVYAFQLWGGGKQLFYNEILPSMDIDALYRNMYKYITHISSLRDYHVNKGKR